MSIGKNIKYYRKLNELSQTELADKLNVSNKTISSWEIDRTEPNMGMVEKMCSVFGITKDELISGIANSVPEYDPDIIEIIDILSKISNEQKQTVLAMLRSFVN